MGSRFQYVSFDHTKINGIKWRPLDPDEPNFSGITGTKLTILGQTNIWVKFNTLKKAQEILALVCKEESEESLVDLDSIQISMCPSSNIRRSHN